MDVLASLNRVLSGRYAIERELGAGGMAKVYLARDLRHHRPVAIKVLRPDLSALIGRDRFLSEISVTANLRHPHIVPLFDSGEADGLLFYVMPYIEGESLLHRLEREGRIPVEEAVRITIVVANALEYAHKHGVIHRDLKPGNILLQDGEALIADFGIALALSEAAGDRLTQTSISLGTPEYMSPEQAMAEPLVDARSDVYSLGSVLYEMLVGRPPHTGSSRGAIVAKVLTERPEQARAIRSAIPPHVDAALRKALERMPTERFPSAGEFARTLATQTIVRLPWLGWAQSRRAVAASGITLSLLVGLVVWWALGSGTTRDDAVSPTMVVVFPFVVPSDPRFAEWGVGLMTVLNGALNGAGELRVVDPIALMNELGRDQKPGLDLRNARRIAQRFGAGHYLVGSVIPLGELADVTLSLYSLQTGDRAIRTKSVKGKPDQLLAVAMDLARDMLVALPVGTGPLADEVLTANSANHEALKYYWQGEALFLKGQYDSALIPLRRSVAADSTLALASYRLSYALDFCARCGSAEITAAIDRAFRHRATASESYRLLIEGYHAYLHGDGKLAQQTALDLTERFPNSVEAWWLLGFTQSWHAWQWGRPPTDGREALERALELDPYHRPTLYGLAGLARFAGNYAVAESLALRANPTGTYLDSRARLMMSFIRRDTATQSLFIRLLPDSSTGRIMLDATGIASHTDDLAGAVRLARLAVDPARRSEGARASAEMFLMLAEISAGRPLSARQVGDSATALDPQTAVAYRAWFAAQPFFLTSRAELSALADTLERWSGKARNLEATDFFYRPPAALQPHLRSYVLGLLRARLGQEQAALAHATALERAYESADSARMLPDFALEIRALAALQAGRASDALDILARARLAIRWHYQVFSSPMSMRPFGRFLRAEILYQLGRYEEALGWYAPFRTGVYDVRIAEFVYRGPALLRSAQINDRLGSAEARGDYERFLSRWPNAEPALSPPVEEARRALVRLK